MGLLRILSASTSNFLFLLGGHWRHKHVKIEIHVVYNLIMRYWCSDKWWMGSCLAKILCTFDQCIYTVLIQSSISVLRLTEQFSTHLNVMLLWKHLTSVEAISSIWSLKCDWVCSIQAASLHLTLLCLLEQGQWNVCKLGWHLQAAGRYDLDPMWLGLHSPPCSEEPLQ